VDIRYGVKVEAVALLQEWVRDIGGHAGLTAFNTQINSGSLGVPESRLELEVSLDSLSHLEQFRAAIPADLHKAWSQRAQHYILDGSPTWQVFVSCPVLPQAEAPASSSAASILSFPAIAEASEDDIFRVRPRARPRAVPVELPAESSDGEVSTSTDPAGPVDWKGDPMIINPGDKMPFF